MFTISKEQIDYFNEEAKTQFIKKMLNKHSNSNYSEIEKIVNESLYFLIKLETDVTKYIQLYLENKPIFESKPKWMLNVLDNDYYSPEDKLTQIELSLNE
ncbi:MAG: hypothetical protein R2764_17070 [Bacteroidales bacterium]